MKKYILILVLASFLSVIASAEAMDSYKIPDIKVNFNKKSITEGKDTVVKWKIYKGEVDNYSVRLKNKLISNMSSGESGASAEKKSTVFSGYYLDSYTIEKLIKNSPELSEDKIRKSFYFEVSAYSNGELVAQGISKTFYIKSKQQSINKKDKSGVTKDDHFITGSISSEVKVVTYSDMQCPFCKQFNNTINELSKEYGSKVAFVFRHFPLSVIHDKAMLAANATECVASQSGENSFGIYLNKVFEAQSDLSKATLSRLAVELGMDKKAFESCLEKETYSKRIDRDIKLAEKMSKDDAVNGVPTSFVYGPNGKKVTISGAQSYSVVKEILDNL